MKSLLIRLKITHLIKLLEKCQLNELAAFIVHYYGLSLGFFDHPAVKAFLYHLRPTYYPFNRNQLNSKLLDQCYEDYIIRVRINL